MTRRERENRIARAVAELTSHDADLARAREVGGPFHDRSRKAGFETLVLLVVEQQLSLASAAAIMGRVREAVVPFTPETLLGLGERRLRGLGLSGAKVKYCRALAQAFIDGNLKPARLARLDDEAAVEAKQAADAAEQTGRLHRIETELAELRAEFRTTSRITLGLLLVVLAVQLAPLFQ